MQVKPYNTELRSGTIEKARPALRVMVLYGWESNPYAECTIRALLAEGARVDFVARDSSPWPIKDPRCTIHPVFPGHRKGRSHLGMLVREIRALAKVARLVRRTNPDVLHYQSYRMIRLDWLLFLWLRLLGRKVVFTVHDTHSLEASAVDSFLFRATARRADVLLVHNTVSRDVIKQDWGVPAERIKLIPHGGYDDYYRPGGDRGESRRRLGCQPDDFVLLSFGTVRKYKGLDYLLPAVADARRTVPGLRLFVAGRAFDHGLGNHYEQMIKELKIGDLARFLNRFIETEELENLFTAADLVILPYVRIDQSGVLFLAYTFGRPVLVTRVGGLPELVKEGRSGFVVEPRSRPALCQGILAAWQKRADLEEMGANARRLVEEEYTWKRQAKITVGAYEELITGF
jgi:D-inositol-3-phosphate glycosyltransferase